MSQNLLLRNPAERSPQALPVRRASRAIPAAPKAASDFGDSSTAVYAGLHEAAAKGEFPPKLRDLAAAAARENRDQPVQFALIATSIADLRDKLAAVRDRRTVDGVHAAKPVQGKVAFVFPGQGSQRPGMLADLFVTFPEVRDLLELGSAYSGRLFPGGAYRPEIRKAQQRAITDTRVAQPTLGIADMAMARLLGRVG